MNITIYIFCKIIIVKLLKSVEELLVEANTGKILQANTKRYAN